MECVALLRGINVGGKNMVDMGTLREAFAELGFAGARTYINSGNVLFACKGKPGAAARKLEAGLSRAFGFAIPVLVRDADNLRALRAAIPAEWRNDGEQKTDVLFLMEEWDAPETLDRVNVTPGVDSLLYAPGAIAWNIARKDHGRSGMRKFIGTKIYAGMTARNVNTVRRLAELLGA